MTKGIRIAIEKFFFEPVSILPLALYRIALGFSILAVYSIYIPRWGELFGHDGLAAFLNPDGVLHPSNLLPWFFLVLLLSSCLGLILGFYSRACCLALYVTHLYLNHLAKFAFGGWRYVLPVFILYMMISPADAALSIRKGAKKLDTIPAWHIRLFQLHLCTNYITASWERFAQPQWLAGQTILRLMYSSYLSRVPQFDWYGVKPFLMALCYINLIVEPLAPILLWFRKSRVAMGMFLLAFHLGILLFTKVTGWSEMMLPAVFCFYLPERYSLAVVRIARDIFHSRKRNRFFPRHELAR
jgi:hypothetical protein